MYIEYRVIFLWSLYIILDDILKNDTKPRDERITEDSFFRKMYQVLLLERCLFPELYKILS